MPTPDLIRLAPTLSAGERLKLIVPDLHRQYMGGKRLISESETQAITAFDKREVWEEYTLKLSMFQWAQAFWPKDIEAERLRVFACSLLLRRSLEKTLWNSEGSVCEKEWDWQLSTLRKYVAMMEKNSALFYSYREAINAIERELYGVPIFNEGQKKQIAAYYEAIDDLFEEHNSIVRMVCGNKAIKQRIRPIIRDMESYLVKKPTPDKKLVEQIVDGIRQIAESDMEMLGR